MNRDHLTGRLKQFSGKLKEQWCKLHDDQVGLVAAKRYQIAGRMQAVCGIAQQVAIQQLRAFKRQNKAWYPANLFPMKSPRKSQTESGSPNRATAMKLVSPKMLAELAAA